MPFILDIIISLTRITGRGGPGVPCCGLKAKGVDTQSETGNTANDISWEVKEHVFGKAVGRMSSQSLFWGQCTLSGVMGENFAVVHSWAAIRIGCPNLQVSFSEVHNKTTDLIDLMRSMGSQFRSFYLNMYFLLDQSWLRILVDQKSSDLELSRMSACKTCLAVVLLHWVKEL